MPTTVLVTFAVGERRALLEETLPDGVKVEYVEDLPEEERAEAVGAADYLLALSPGQELTDEQFARLRGDQKMQLVSAGVDQVPFGRLPEAMEVFGNGGAYAEPMAEHVLALYFALAKRLPIEHHQLQQGAFNQFEQNRWVDGSTCGIFGFGAIGQAAARLLKRLGVAIHAINRSGTADEPVAFLGTPDRLGDVLARCDGLVVSAPLTPETRGCIGREELETMADDAFIINVSRGELIDQQALYEHLKAHPAFQAGLEAWWVEPVRHGSFSLDYPFLELPNVVGCPHNSATLPGAVEHGLAQAAENVRRAVTTGQPRHAIDREVLY